MLSRSLATGKLQATLKLILYYLFFLLVVFFLGSSIAQFAISTSFCIQSGPEVGIVILFFKNSSRSQARGNLQATLNGICFWIILILSRSRATGKLQATLKLICNLFLIVCCSNHLSLNLQSQPCLAFLLVSISFISVHLILLLGISGVGAQRSKTLLCNCTFRLPALVSRTDLCPIALAC